MTTYYSDDHEWIKVDGDIAVLGITAYAAEQLGDIVFVEQKEEGDQLEKGDEIGVIESVKAASEIFSPLNCTIVGVNEALVDAPNKLNESPEDDAWIYKIKITDETQLDDLMDIDAYKALIG